MKLNKFKWEIQGRRLTNPFRILLRLIAVPLIFILYILMILVVFLSDGRDGVEDIRSRFR